MALLFFRVGALLLLGLSAFGAAASAAPAPVAPTPALQALIARAEAADSEAQLKLGEAYTHGEGVKADPLEAARWLMKTYAVDPSPYVEEMLLELSFQHADLGDRYLAKYSPPEVRALAAKAKTGDKAARFDLAQRQFSGDGMVLDHGRAHTTLLELAGQGYAPAQFEMANRVEDEAEAKAWLEKAVAQNLPAALFQHGTGLVRSSDDAAKARGQTLVEKAAMAGHGSAMLFLARYYRDFENNPKALEWGHRALDANQEGAQEFVTELLADMKTERERVVAAKATPAPKAASAGATKTATTSTQPPASKTTPVSAPSSAPASASVTPQAEINRIFAEATKEYQAQNYGQAFKLFGQAAALGQPDAMFNLGVMHEQGQGTAKNFTEAVAWFEKAAAKGQRAATPELLKNYRSRLAFQRGFEAHTKNDFATAFAEWTNAAGLGNLTAMFNLAVLTERGQGTKADPVAALAWVEKAAAGGYTKGVPELTKRLKGQIAGNEEFQKGLAAENAKDFVTARGWFEQAEAAGNIPVLAKLGYFYQRGITVMQDLAKAKKFYERARDGGDEFVAMDLSFIQGELDTAELMASQVEIRRLSASIDGRAADKFSAAATAIPTQAEIDALIKKSPWSLEDVHAALKRGVKHRALAVALATDKMTDFYVSDYERLMATPEMQGYENYGRLVMTLLDHRKPGAGQWALDATKAAIAARRAQLGASANGTVDSAELRAKALAGDVAELYAVAYLPEKKRTRGPLSPELDKKIAELKTLVQQKQFKPAYWMLDDDLVYNSDKSKVNIAQAVAYYRASAEAGDARGAEKLAKAYFAPGEVGVAPNYLEAEYWFIEAAARSTPEDFAGGLSPETSIYLLYGFERPIGFGGMQMRLDDAGLRWARELTRRGGKFAETVALHLTNERKEPHNANMDARLAALPPEVPPFSSGELAKLEAGAKSGDVTALLKLAEAYASGRGVRQHDVKANDYFQQAAAKGSASAMRRLAENYQKGYGVKPSEPDRIAWLRKAGDAGDSKAWLEVGALLKGPEMLAAYEKAAAAGEQDGWVRVANANRYGWNDLPKDDAKFLTAMQKAIATGYVAGNANIARFYKDKHDKQNAIVWYRKAVEAGDKAVRGDLASVLFDNGEKEAARAVYLELAQEGNVTAQMMTASFVAESGDVDGAENWYRKVAAGPASDDQKRAARLAREYEEERKAAPGTLPYFRKLAKKGDLDAMMNYARALAPTDRDEAMYWLRRSADGGHAMATSMLVGELVKTKREDAIAWVKSAAEKGNTQAQLIQALELSTTNKAAALAGIEKVAAAGNAEAKYRLGMMLFNGTEMPKDTVRGFALVKESADAGFPAAQTDYGRVLVVGMPGVAPDPAVGIVYLEKAAQQQLPQAIALLGEIYERGLGGPADPGKALRYYLQAQKLGMTQVAPAVQRLQIQLSGKTPPPAAIKK